MTEQSGNVVGRQEPEERAGKTRKKRKGVTLVESVTLALADAMEEDGSVFVLGEDVAVKGGVFSATKGLLDRFGPDRVIDTPLSETVIAGAAVGAAMGGMRPVFEIQFLGFIHAAMDQLKNHAARMRNRTRGRLFCPLVCRAPFGAGIGAPEHHSESIEAVFAHIPGLRVVVPSTPERAYRLLLSSIRSNDPVIFLEPKRLYRGEHAEFAADGKHFRLDRAFVDREGSDVTLVSWGASLRESRAAAELLSEEGVSVEVIDLTTLGSGWDKETVFASFEKTGRCVIVHEAPLTGGFGATVSAALARERVLHISAPIELVTGYDVVPPLSRYVHYEDEGRFPARDLEKLYIPSVWRIVEAIRHIVGEWE